MIIMKMILPVPKIRDKDIKVRLTAWKYFHQCELLNFLEIKNLSSLFIQGLSDQNPEVN